MWRLSRSRAGLAAFTIPACAAVAVIVVVPASYAFYLSLTNYDLLGGERKYIGFENYRAAFADPVFVDALIKTFVFSTVALTIELVLGLALARMIAARMRASGLWRTMLLVPLMFPPVLAGYQFRWMFNPDVGIVNNLIYEVTGTQAAVNWLTDVPEVWLSVLLAELWLGIPFFTIILLAGMTSIPPEPLEAAQIDGATSWQSFRNVVLPLLSPFIWTALLLRSFDLARFYDVIQVMTAGGPIHRTETLWTYVGEVVTVNGSFAYGAAMSVILSITSVAFSVMIFRNLFKARRLAR